MQATIDSWRLGWNFTAKEAIQSPQNVYTPGVQVITLDPPYVQLQGLGINNTVKPFSWMEISFLGSKSTLPVPNAQYKASCFASSFAGWSSWFDRLLMQPKLQTERAAMSPAPISAGGGCSSPMLEL